MVKKILKYSINLLGYDIEKKRSISEPGYRGEYSYEKISPLASLAPWHNDKDFTQIFNIIKNGKTLVDIYRCYELWTLIEEVQKIPEKGGFIEIGVWRGGTTALIAKKLKLLGSTEKVYSADTFHGVVKADSRHDFAYKGGEHADTSKEAAMSLFSNLELMNIEILQGIFPDETGHLIPSGTRFKFCHIDVDVYQSAKDIVNWIWDKLLPGGVIVYDDYGFHGCSGITKFVHEESRKKDRIIIQNLNGHAICIKRA